MPLTKWDALNRQIVEESLEWNQVKDDLLEILWELDELRRNGAIPEGQYRQKGNYFKDTIVSLIRAHCGIELVERSVQGRTDIHKVDFCYIHRSSATGEEKNEVVLMAGEVKMIGSPRSKRGGETYPERTITIDIDKRAKEVKYTPVDLKRVLDPDVKEGWQRLIEGTPPAFFAAWLMRLADANNLQHVISKLEGMTEYTNGVAIAIYKEEHKTRYAWVDVLSENPKLLSIQGLVEQICDVITST